MNITNVGGGVTNFSKDHITSCNSMSTVVDCTAVALNQRKRFCSAVAVLVMLDRCCACFCPFLRFGVATSAQELTLLHSAAQEMPEKEHPDIPSSASMTLLVK